MISVKIDKNNWKVDIVINGIRYDGLNTMVENGTKRLYVRVDHGKLYI